MKTIFLLALFWISINAIGQQTKYERDMMLMPYAKRDSLPFLMNTFLYVDSVNTVADSAVFNLTSNKLSTGTAIFNNIYFVLPTVNSSNSVFGFGWTISSDKKKLVVKARKADNTGIITLLGINLLGATTAVATGTKVYLAIRGN